MMTRMPTRAVRTMSRAATSADPMAPPSRVSSEERREEYESKTEAMRRPGVTAPDRYRGECIRSGSGTGIRQKVAACRLAGLLRNCPECLWSQTRPLDVPLLAKGNTRSYQTLAFSRLSAEGRECRYLFLPAVEARNWEIS